MDLDDLRDRVGITIGWGASASALAVAGYQTETTCDYKKGIFDPDDLPSKLKKINLKYKQ